MPNVITDLIPLAYAAMDVVAREMIGFVSAVRRNSSADRVSQNQQLVIPITEPRKAENITPGVVPGAVDAQTVGNVKVEIDKFRTVAFSWTGEEIGSLDQGPGHANIEDHEITQAFRTLTNEIEGDLGVLYKNASRAFETGGNKPFNTKDDLSDASFTRKILMDNGTPMNSLQLVMNTDAGARLRGKQPSLFRVNEAGTDEILRRGLLERDLFGFALRESDKITSHGAGTGDSYAVNNSGGYEVGDVSIKLDTGVSGDTILAGDIITFAGDVNKYVVASGFTGVSGAITLAKPGLRKALANDAVLSYEGDYTANVAMRSSAIVLATRLPVVPKGGDIATMVYEIMDPKTGLVFELREYQQYRQVRYEVSIAYGVKVIKPEFMALMV